METEKERSTGDRTESFSSVPLDLTIEILLRLPAKSVGRFRCVSKLWSSMTTTASFVKSFSVHSSARPSLLLFKNEEDKRVFYSLPHHDHNDPRNNTRTEKYQMILPKEETGISLRSETDKNYIAGFHIPQSIHGLISFRNSESVIIWNPTLRQHVTLPDPPNLSKPFISLLGYDPIGDEYKVLCMSLCEDARSNGEEPQIFTMGAQESWRRLIQNSPSPIHCKLKNWRCIKGVIYYFAADGTILSFDVRSEKFGVIQVPEELRCTIMFCGFHVAMGAGFIRHRGRLALFYNISSMIGEVKLWVLEDAEKHEWSRTESILPFEATDLIPWNGSTAFTTLLISGETAHDELIYLPPITDVGPFYAVYYDLERNSVRKVVYEGTDENKFRFHCFPNHIESLKSLTNLLTGA